jgi:hypothetical protein
MDNYRQRLGLTLLAGSVVLMVVITGIGVVAPRIPLWVDSPATVATHDLASLPGSSCLGDGAWRSRGSGEGRSSGGPVWMSRRCPRGATI